MNKITYDCPECKTKITIETEVHSLPESIVCPCDATMPQLEEQDIYMIHSLFLIPAFAAGFYVCYITMTYGVDQEENNEVRD